MTAIITVAGGLTSEPEIRFSQNSLAIASFTVASTERYLDKKTNEWVDGKKLYLRCSAFREIAENIGQSRLEKGTQVSVTGKLHTREWEQDGQKRSSTELDVTDFSVSLKRATVQVTKTSGNSSAGQSSQYAAPAPQQPQQAAQQDVWGAPGETYPAAESLPF